ncbi:riboflavin biosynthesis protein RibF [Zongyangia hominis]|uniref:Riboflavin biosynthesis protein n=1 Tax=Zongyangia hominis TaxID=2763677 RepID=A0A926EE52_9FIRM|nr:riboflavin biosynthesis protein RibF [Zongyangia hominis]MBC8570441.1 riboflavin biosynthesis protein RibF [Zongyangia hominis]
MIRENTLDIQGKEPTAVALGLFDGVHKGHRAVLAQALAQRERGLIPCVFTFTFDGGAPPSKQGNLAIMTPERRSEIFSQLGFAYEICPPFSAFCNLTPREYVEEILMKRLWVKFVACGYDFRFGKGAAGDVETLRELCGERGIEVRVVEHVDDGGHPVSSTRIRHHIENGEIEEANRLMESLFSIGTRVVHGRRLGRTLDFPTINQPFPAGCIIPRFGVYASLAFAGGRWREAVTNVGIKPTVAVKDPLAETYILDFTGDLYGKNVEVRLLSFLRPEEKFGSLEELKERIWMDSEDARRISGAYLAGLEKNKKFTKNIDKRVPAVVSYDS